MASIKCQHYWLDCLDKHADFFRVYEFSDSSKAFDSVSHQIVCKKLKTNDVNPYIINWIISFLNNCKQRMVVVGLTTEFVSISQSLPQETVLGPFLFSLQLTTEPTQPLQEAASG